MKNYLLPMSCFVVLAFVTPIGAGTDNAPVTITHQEKGLQIKIAGKPFATYSFGDDTVKRPFFAHVHAPNGIQVTRNYPPVQGKDTVDHADMHPGLWLAFGNLGGSDFWRNKGTVKHVKFLDQPKDGAGASMFTVVNHYLSNDKLVCEETRTVSVLVRPAGYLLILDTVFKSDKDFYFGDQEEMGLGVRLATPLTVVKGGQIINSNGMKNEKEAWGKQADWCEYSGTIDGKRLGVVLMPHPGNFRKSWFHTRDYGLVAANPFGQNAFTKGPVSKVAVKAGESFRLRYGVLIFGSDAAKGPDVPAAYQDYLKLAKE